MNSLKNGKVRAVVNLSEGTIEAAAEIAASPERVFHALTSREVCQWWVRPGVMDTREWTGDVRAGGRWQASGVARGKPYALEGEFLEVHFPGKVAHTWQAAGAPLSPSTVAYVLEPFGGGTRIALKHSGLRSAEACENTCVAWQTSFKRLQEILVKEPPR